MVWQGVWQGKKMKVKIELGQLDQFSQKGQRG